MKAVLSAALPCAVLAACSQPLFVEWIPARSGVKPMHEVSEYCRAAARRTEVRVNPKCQSPAMKSQTIARSCDSEDRFDRAALAGQAADAAAVSFDTCMNDNGYTPVKKDFPSLF